MCSPPSSLYHRLGARRACQVLALLLLIAAGGCAPRRAPAPLSPVMALAETPTAVDGEVQVETAPPGVAVFWDDVLSGNAPLILAATSGEHILRLEADGFAPQTVVVDVVAGQRQHVSYTLQDDTAPVVTLESLPEQIVRGDDLQVLAAAEDAGGIVALRLVVDGRVVREAAGETLSASLDTRTWTSGPHTLQVVAEDAAGLQGQALAVVEVAALPTPTAESPTPTATLAPAPTPTVTRGPQPTRPPVTAYWSEVTIDTYAYRQALYTDPQAAGHPYPLLDRDGVGPQAPQTYRLLVLRNEYLEISILPELGGRIYQVRYLPTGQGLLYNNRVIKPSPWGPPEQGWWLGVGGIEFSLPVAEHGYLTAEPWAADWARRADGGVTVTLRADEQSRGLETWVEVTLLPGQAGFALRPSLHNPGSQAQSAQWWVNAMVSPGTHGVGPSLRVFCPASEVIVHSCGDETLPGAGQRMPWPIADGRDLRHYGNWRDWLGFFSPNPSPGYMAVYDEATQVGLVRSYPAEVARGAKFFGFGVGFDEEGAYTDDGSQYLEMWGGWTPTFWDDGTLEPGQTVSWEEHWFVLSGFGEITTAGARGALSVRRNGEQLHVGVASREHGNWQLVVMAGDREVFREPFAVSPEAPLRQELALNGATDAGRLTVLVEAAGETLLRAQVD